MLHTFTLATPGAFVGDPDTHITINVQGTLDTFGRPLAYPGATVAYHVTDRAGHTVCGADIKAPLGYRARPSDLFQAVAGFLNYEPEHADAHDRGLWDSEDGVCPEYGAGCPAARQEYIAALAQLAPSLAELEYALAEAQSA